MKKILVLLFNIGLFQYGHARSRGCCRTDEVIQDLNSRIVNPSHPEPDSAPASHTFKIEIQPGICGLRLNYEKVKLANPSMMSSSCTHDTLTVIVPGHPTLPNCGVLTGFTMNYPVHEGDMVEILVVTQSRSHYWNIVASQIPCGAVDSQPLSREADNCGRRPRSQGLTTDIGTGLGLTYNTPAYHVPIVNDPSIFSCPSGNSYMRCYLESIGKESAKKWEHHDRIVNGRPARRHSWPWQVVFLIKGQFLLCGGALLSSTVAITAGHCLSFIQKSMNISDVVVGVGIHRLNFINTGAMYRKCKNIVLHPQYTDIHQDVSLCHLDAPLPIGDHVGPVCLPYDEGETYVGKEGHITGWGKTSDSSEHASVLQEASIPIVKNSECAKAWSEEGGPGFGDFIEDSMICGGGNNKSTCNGDSGGPLTIVDGDRHVLAGVTSFGPSSHCNVAGKPLSVFTRISSQMRFISLAVARVDADEESIRTYTPC